MSHTILLRSGWQTVNIGDIAHTPGVVQLLRRHFDDLHFIIWPNPTEQVVIEMLHRHLPGVEILEPTDPFQVNDAIDRADFFLHGSGPSVVGRQSIEHRWLHRTDKPFGVLGVTIQHPDAELVDLLNRAAFIYTRETHSLEHLARVGCTCPIQAMTPDGVFAMDIRDHASGERALRERGLEPGKFICVVPRLRYTPYHHIRGDVDWSSGKIRDVEEVNARTGMNDHAWLREPIIRWVRETGMKVLACPEMSYQLDILGPLVVDPLPPDVAAHVVTLDRWWLPDEAQAVYQHARCVVSMECHSPIMAIGVQTPAFYIRQKEDTIKGQMYYDMGLDDWIFELEATDPAAIAQRLMNVHQDFDRAKAYAAAAIRRYEVLHGEAMATLAGVLGVRGHGNKHGVAARDT